MRSRSLGRLILVAAVFGSVIAVPVSLAAQVVSGVVLLPDSMTPTVRVLGADRVTPTS